VNRAAGVLELIDRPVPDRRELERNLADIAFANRWFGGIAPVRRELRRCGARSVLDVGTGGADVPYRLVRELPLQATCLDRSETMLEIARGRCADEPRLTFARGEGEALPYADGAFDAATCSLTLHHCEPEAATALLRELRRVARITPIVVDLVRSRSAYGATWLFARLCARSRLTYHDAPLSVRRAYTPTEALALARAAGWRRPRVRGEPFFRMTLVDD
jgi:ubiquinone/menaquinone biosynthesis C-methylase UbiE